MPTAIYTAMTGATSTLKRQETIANDIVQASTIGFRAQLNHADAVDIGEAGSSSTTTVRTKKSLTDFSYGTFTESGNPLDVSINGAGWLSVLSTDGTEAYTRRGDLSVNADNLLINGNGSTVLGNGGPINVPEYKSISITPDGSINIIPKGGDQNTEVTIGRLKLVNGDNNTLIRQQEGLFKVADGAQPFQVDATVRVQSEGYETSNVDPVAAMVSMLEVASNHDFNLKMINGSKEQEMAAIRLMQITNT